MVYLKIVWLLLISVPSSLCSIAKSNSVQAVAMVIRKTVMTLSERSLCTFKFKLSRHGDRTPVLSYANDPYKFYPWPGGFGALTPKGARQTYRSGMIKAVRYENLLNNQSLGTDSIYVRSSSIERCIVTAESFLDGFLQNADKVAPINIVPPLEDAMLKFPGMPCPKHKLEFIRNVRLNQPDAVELTNYGMFLKYVEYHSGEDIRDLEHLATIGDTLAVERNYGLEIPSWAEDIYDDFTPVLEFTMDKMSSSKWLQIKSGLLLNDIFDRFNHFIRPPPYQKQRENVLFYSAHDLNVQSLLVLLGVFDQTRVRADYGAVVALELHQNKSLRDDMEVQIFYFRDFGDEDPINVRIPSCPAPCAYSKFKDLMKSKLVKNYRRACY